MGLLFGLVGLVGLAALPAAPAAAATTTSVAVAEAEQGVFEGWYMRTVADSAASSGSAVRFDWTGSLRLTVKLPADADSITLRVRGDQCAGAPAYTVTIDHEEASSGTVASTSWTEQTHAGTLYAGTHSVVVRFTNDHLQWWPACDRNLYLDAVTFSASGTGAPAGNPPVPPGFVHQSGTRLLDGANEPIRLRGTNLGGWLHWEGWLWGQGFDYIGESAMMSNLTSLVGTAQAEQFRADVRANYITAADFKAMSSHGINVARVGFNYRLLEDDAQPFTYKQAAWDVLDKTVAAAKQHNVYLVPVMQAAPCSQMYAFVSDYVGPDFLWNSEKCQDRMVAMWKAIAARYADENIIAGYDLLGETIIGDQQLLGLYKRLTAAIREVDRNHLIIYEGNHMARTFDLFTEPLDSNQALSVHDYPWAFPGEDLSVRMVKYDAAATRLNSPQWVGEFGQSIYADIERYIDTFDRDPLIAGWAMYVWKQVPGFASMQRIEHTAASRKLVEWMNHTSRPRPTNAEAAQGMSDFVRAVRFENTLPDAKLRRILECRYNCTPPAAGTPQTAEEGIVPEPAPASEPSPPDPAPASEPSPPDPAPASEPSPPATATPAAGPTLAASARPAPLRAALRNGVEVSVTAPGAGRLTAAATRAGKVLGAGGVRISARAGKVVARGRTTTAAAGRRAMTLRFTARARKALRRAYTVPLTLETTYIPAGGLPISETVKVTLER